MKSARKILFMGSLSTLNREDERELAEQELHFVRACMAMGALAAQRGHCLLLADDHRSSADYHVMQGVIAHAQQNPHAVIRVEVHRPEGAMPIYQGVPKNISVEHCFHPDAGSVSYGTLIPNLAALEASDAVVLVGGRLTVKLIGEIALDKERPVLAIPSFGGTAAEIYEALKYAYKARLPAHYDKISLLRSVWRDDSAERALDIAELLADNETEVAAHSYFLSYRWANSSLADHVSSAA
jgi:hypothetical protein